MHTINMGSAERRNKSKSKKRKCYRLLANKIHLTSEYTTSSSNNTSNNTSLTNTSSSKSASAEKLNLPTSDTPSISQDSNPECYIIFNSDVLSSILNLVGSCPKCQSLIKLNNDLSRKKGFSHQLVLSCTAKKCQWQNEFFTSKKIEKNSDNETQGMKSFDINIRMCVAFREIGKGYAAMESFCNIINSPPPMQKKTYNNIVYKLHSSYIKVAQDSMKRAAAQAQRTSESTIGDPDIKNVTVSVDGTWQRRGFSSLNGVVTAISNGKCVDTQTLIKDCKSCQYWQRNKDIPGYNDWVESHICPINHKGSAGAMEAIGALQIFKRSTVFNKLRYTKYCDDGDSKSYQNIESNNVYPGYKIEKSECVSHVQKRVGSRLRSLKVLYKGKVLKDGKRLTGKGRMTDKVINTLQNYYGMSIRQNKGNLYGMKKSIAGLIHHCSESSSDEERHKYCPRTSDSWCKYQRDKINQTLTYKNSINIPEAVCEIIKPIFSHKDLGANKLLKRCLDGET